MWDGTARESRAARQVTLADIARAAGTSPSTASRALSGRGYVSAGARERLFEAAERLGYVPNASARALKRQASRVIGVAVSDLQNQFYANLAAGVEQTLRAADYQTVLISDNSRGDEELEAARTFLEMRTPGVIMTPVGHDAAGLLVRRGTIVVEVDRRLARVACDAVVVDNERGARDAVLHLLDRGHRRIGLLVVATEWTSDAGRLAGYRAAHAERATPIDEQLIVRVAPGSELDGHVDRLLDEQAPTAIFAANNLLAEQAWRALRERGLRLPGDVSLIGFDDVPWMAMVEPGITAVSQPTFEMGRRAAHLLLARLEDFASAPAIERLEPSLVVRGSTAPPGAGSVD